MKVKSNYQNLVYTSILITIFIYIFTIPILTSAAIKTILIDPGHGGDDVGAKGNFHKYKKGLVVGSTTYYEKNLSLELSKKIFEKLNKKYTVYLTRSFDHAVSLEERAQMAEKIKADIFISIHLNSDPKKVSHGFETYYLDNHNDLAVKKVENIENQKLSKNDDLVVNKILIDLIIERTVDKSSKLAAAIHSQIKRGIGREYSLIDRGVRPGLFYVLALAKRPSVLLEVGFISNSEEARKLSNEEFQEKYANDIVNGIDYFLQNER